MWGTISHHGSNIYLCGGPSLITDQIFIYEGDHLRYLIKYLSMWGTISHHGSNIYLCGGTISHHGSNIYLCGGPSLITDQIFIYVGDHLRHLIKYLSMWGTISHNGSNIYQI